MVSLPKLTQLRFGPLSYMLALALLLPEAQVRGHLTLLVCFPSRQANALPIPVEDASVSSSRIYPSHWVSC